MSPSVQGRMVETVGRVTAVDDSQSIRVSRQADREEEGLNVDNLRFSD